MRYHFVINPHAGRVQLDEVLAVIGRHFAADEVCIHRELPPTAQPPWTPPDKVVAVGGDGTVHRVVNAVAGTGCAIGILPRGTSNDLARELGIPFDLNQACALLREGTTSRIDLVQVNSTFLVTAGGLGVPAAIADRANRWKAARGLRRIVARALGRGVYVAAAVVDLAGRWRPVHGALVPGDGSAPWAAVIVSNQSRLGPFSASPAARNRDGWLDVCTIEAPRPAPRMLWIALRMLFARGSRCVEVRASRARRLVVECAQPQPFLGDGEILETARRFEIEVRPSALKVIGPVRSRLALAPSHVLRKTTRVSRRPSWSERGRRTSSP
jgi:diacylglycerol kinase family enzyme